MCGILGQIHPKQRLAPEVLHSIAHRGPDASGIWHTELAQRQLSLGHTRLSILDLSEAGAQPMHSQSGRWHIVFNGEIYNHLELRKAYLPLHNFKGSSDTETLIELIDQIGLDEILPQLNGMFAFAALNDHSEQLHLVRDPFGIKPLYYHHDGPCWHFASELKALFQMGVAKNISAEHIDTFMLVQYVPSPNTLIDKVYRLGPGELLSIELKTNQSHHRRYIHATQHRYCSRFDHAVEDYEQQLRAAVNRQMLSDVPVGILLSGGIDSALVAAMATEGGHCPPCFTVGFGEQHSECEIDDAAHTARVLGLEHHSVTLNPDSMWSSLEHITASLEEPMGTTSIMAMWELVRLARQHVTVVLTGQGTDEPWGGYQRYQLELWRHLLPNKLWKLLSIAPKLPQASDALDRILRSVPLTDNIQRAIASNTLFSEAEQQSLLGRKASSTILYSRFKDWMTWSLQSPLPLVDQLMRCDTRMKLSDDLLLYGDKISMAVALEARVPMLDIELIQFVEALPIQYRLRRGQSKIVHKAMAEKYLPSSIVHRPKKGFYVPFDAWSRGIWKDRIADYLLSDGPHHQLLDPQGLRQLWNHHQQTPKQSPRRLFALLMFAHWSYWLDKL